MTVKELIAQLKDKPEDATVYISRNDGDDVHEIFDVSLSEDAPDSEVYIDCNE